ncbi:hypothetical protein IWZ03DRAFT_358299 [Phyllosticta citriasiana]|uniref:Uncharacterized protein n=1 Tax=Phyllosticta citriasiana TaxID=595635 RepID=A0ABR1KRX0_9PEZI
MPSITKLLFNTLSGLSKGNTWQKLTKVTVSPGKTVYPLGAKEQKRLGWRLDYDGEVKIGEIVFNKLQLKLNAGDIPATLKHLRDKKGGTHAKDGDLEDVKTAIDEGLEKMQEDE